MKITRILASIPLAASMSCFSATIHAVEVKTLTDSEGRSISGEVLALDDSRVRFHMSNRPPIDILLAKLSEKSCEDLADLRESGEIPLGPWPERGAAPGPYRFKADGTVWTGTHVSITYPREPKSRSSSSSEVAFLRTIDLTIAAAKAIPLGLVERDKIFACEVLTHRDYSDAVIRIKKREKERRKLDRPTPPGGRRDAVIVTARRPEVINFDRSARYFPHCLYDDVEEVLYIREDAPAQFTEPDPKAGTWIPLALRPGIVREATLDLVFGKRWNYFPSWLRPGLLGYFDTIEQVAGPDLDYSKIPSGVRKLMRAGVPRIKGTRLESIPLDARKAAQLLAELPGAADDDVNRTLLAYFFLHFDRGGNAAGLAASVHVAMKEEAARQKRIDEHNAALTEFQFKTVDFNRDVAEFNKKVEVYNLAIRSGAAHRPEHPGEPSVFPLRPEILTSFENGEGAEAWKEATERKCRDALFQGRTINAVVADFENRMAVLSGIRAAD